METMTNAQKAFLAWFAGIAAFAVGNFMIASANMNQSSSTVGTVGGLLFLGSILTAIFAVALTAQWLVDR